MYKKYFKFNYLILNISQFSWQTEKTLYYYKKVLLVFFFFYMGPQWIIRPKMFCKLFQIYRVNYSQWVITITLKNIYICEHFNECLHRDYNDCKIHLPSNWQGKLCWLIHQSISVSKKIAAWCLYFTGHLTCRIKINSLRGIPPRILLSLSNIWFSG